MKKEVLNLTHPGEKGAEVIGGQNAEYYYDEKVKKITSNVCLRIRSPGPAPLVCQILHEAT